MDFRWEICESISSGRAGRVGGEAGTGFVRLRAVNALAAAHLEGDRRAAATVEQLMFQSLAAMGQEIGRQGQF